MSCPMHDEELPPDALIAACVIEVPPVGVLTDDELDGLDVVAEAHVEADVEADVGKGAGRGRGRGRGRGQCSHRGR